MDAADGAAILAARTVCLPAMRRGERAMALLFGSVYETYQREVPQFLPHRLPVPALAGGFSWRNPNLLHT